MEPWQRSSHEVRQCCSSVSQSFLHSTYDPANYISNLHGADAFLMDNLCWTHSMSSRIWFFGKNTRKIKGYSIVVWWKKRSWGKQHGSRVPTSRIQRFPWTRPFAIAATRVMTRSKHWPLPKCNLYTCQLDSSWSDEQRDLISRNSIQLNLLVIKCGYRRNRLAVIN